MSVINWIQYTEPVVAANDPNFPDVANRPLVEVFEASGLDPADDFTGFVSLVAEGRLMEMLLLMVILMLMVI